jgi:hypothetical protein
MILWCAFAILVFTACGSGGFVPEVYEVGDTGPAGGVIFYVDTANAYPWTYLESALDDISGGKAWASAGFLTTDIVGTSTAIGSGAANTSLILATDENAPAAKACADYSFGGYNDWFLPSEDELGLMVDNRTIIGGFSDSSFHDSFYWSSSQIDPPYSHYEEWALVKNFYIPTAPHNARKDEACLVRAIRAF